MLAGGFVVLMVLGGGGSVMSFSDEIDDKNKRSIVPEFSAAVQISEKEALRIQIASIADEETRTSGERRFAFAEQRIQAMQDTYFRTEAQFVDAGLKMGPTLDLELGGEELSYEQKVERLKGLFAQTHEAKDMRQRIVVQTQMIWGYVHLWADTHAAEQSKAPDLEPAPEQRPEQKPDRGPDTDPEPDNVIALRPHFTRATERWR